MMKNKRCKALALRLEEVLLHGKWIANTNCKDQITNITWSQAIQQIENLNTIAKLTYHINYYLEGLLQVLNGGPLETRDKYSFDLPEIKDEKDWNELTKRFIQNSESFVEKIKEMEDDMLDQDFVKKEYGNYLRNIEAIIEHSYYHLGQISLIKKMIISKQN